MKIKKIIRVVEARQDIFNFFKQTSLCEYIY